MALAGNLGAGNSCKRSQMETLVVRYWEEGTNRELGVTSSWEGAVFQEVNQLEVCWEIW